MNRKIKSVLRLTVFEVLKFPVTLEKHLKILFKNSKEIEFKTPVELHKAVVKLENLVRLNLKENQEFTISYIIGSFVISKYNSCDLNSSQQKGYKRINSFYTVKRDYGLI